MIIEYPLDNSTREFGTDRMANLEDTVCINITCMILSVPKRMVCDLTCSQSVDPHTSFTQRYYIKSCNFSLLSYF